MAEPWERIPATPGRNGETTPAFDAFARYRDMGPERSLGKVAKELAKSTVIVGRWSSRWGWVVRAADYDAYMDREKVKASRQAIIDMNNRHVGLATSIQTQVAAVLHKHADALKDDPTATMELSPDQLARLLDVSTRLERMARGAPTEIVEERYPDDEVDYSDWTEEELEQLEAMHERHGRNGHDPAGQPSAESHQG